MTWNYRIIAVDSGGEIEYGIYEVYYDEEGNPESYTENAVPCVGNSIDEMRRTLDYMRMAFGMPVLTERDFW